MYNLHFPTLLGPLQTLLERSLFHSLCLEQLWILTARSGSNFSMEDCDSDSASSIPADAEAQFPESAQVDCGILWGGRHSLRAVPICGSKWQSDRTFRGNCTTGEDTCGVSTKFRYARRFRQPLMLMSRTSKQNVISPTSFHQHRYLCQRRTNIQAWWQSDFLPSPWHFST